MQQFCFAIIGLIFIGCTDNAAENTTIASNVETNETVADEKASTIPIFQVVFDSSQLTSRCLLNDILLDLENSFEKYKFKSTSNEQKEKIENIEAKRFQKTLSADFNNTLFESVSVIDFVSVSPKNNELSPIQLEQWRFESDETADSCFESLTRYQEKEIHFMTINWMWFKQKNSLFLISSLNYSISSEEMNNLKEIVTHELEKNGAYRSVSFYE